MVDPDRLKELSDELVERSSSDEIEFRVMHTDNSLTRYANSRIHQNIHQDDYDVSIRAVIGKRVGAASTNTLEEESIFDCLKRAETIAENQRADPQFQGLPASKEAIEGDSDFNENTAEYTPMERARKVKEIIDYAEENNIDRMYGAFNTQVLELFVANSMGIHSFSRMTKANLTATAIADWDNDQGFGWSERCSADVGKIGHRNIAEVAVQKGLDNLKPESIEPGEYTVILEPLAVKTILMYLSLMGFSARKVQEQRSFMIDKFGEQIMDERVNIYDDANDDEMIGFPFDYEGVPKQKVEIIKDGVANEVVYDTYTAGRDEEDKESTGHALPMPNPNSPLPLNVIMDNGKGDISDMIADTEKGILITRFNYCRPVHPVKGILTGLTRDGTWLIKSGEVERPLKNLRFTQNLIEAFNNIDSIGEERKPFSLGYYPGYILSPAMKIREFNFTGTTEF